MNKGEWKSFLECWKLTICHFIWLQRVWLRKKRADRVNLPFTNLPVYDLVLVDDPAKRTMVFPQTPETLDAERVALWSIKKKKLNVPSLYFCRSGKNFKISAPTQGTRLTGLRSYKLKLSRQSSHSNFSLTPVSFWLWLIDVSSAIFLCMHRLSIIFPWYKIARENSHFPSRTIA